MKKLYLVDVSSLFFRAFYAIRQLNNKSGMPTNALYGFLAATVKLLKEHQPDGLAFCYDRPEQGFREKIYPEYKANRDEAPADLVTQIPYIDKLAKALSISAFDCPGYEADDIIGTLAKKSKRQGLEVVIVSGDKDFAQLVEPGVKLFDPAKDLYSDSQGVRSKFGVDPDQIIDYLALVGDASDNVPGVKGIGPKGAQKLLNEYKNLDGIFAHLDEIKNDRIREMLRTHKDMAYLSQKLCTIHCDMDIPLEPNQLAVKPVNRDLLVPLLEELEFKTLLSRLVGGAEGQSDLAAKAPSSAPSRDMSESEKPDSETISATGADEGALKRDASTVQVTSLTPDEVVVTTDLKDLDKAIKNLKSQEIWFDVTPRGTALKFGEKVFRYEGNIEGLTGWLNENLSRRAVAFSGYDTKSVAHQLKIEPSAFTKVGTDVLLEAYCTGHGWNLDFAAIAKQKLGSELPEFALPEERLFAVRQLSEVIRADLKPGRLAQILSDIEQPLIPVLFEMEYTGVLVDTEGLNKFSQELIKESQALEKEICQVAGYDFNVGSTKQLGVVLFEKLQLPTARKTKTGYSTDSDVLEKLKALHPVAGKILEWRELTKLRSTYVDALPRLVNPRTGRVHTSFNQAVTATGRLSSNNPNVQNIPIRTPRGQRIRDSFVAQPGSLLVSADYSQVELRILAHITDDKALKRAFAEDIDIHTATASEVFSVPLSAVNAEHRRAAKAINFGIAYGMSDFGLAESLGIDRKAAADYIDRYFKRFTGVQKYMHDVIEQGKNDGYVETYLGRRRYYPELKSSNGRLRQVAERAAINMPIQGAAADIIKIAMVKMNAKVHEKYGRGAMLLQVHDELIMEVKKEQAEELQKDLKSWMETAVTLSVPLKVSVGAGANWGEAH